MPNHFTFQLDPMAEYERWILAIEATDGDPTLTQHVQAGRARYLAHVECKRTYFRSAFMSATSRFEMEISGDAIFGAVEVSLLVVATEDISDYQHPNQHTDYDGGSFSVSVGEPLAVAVTQGFDAFLELDPILRLDYQHQAGYGRGDADEGEQRRRSNCYHSSNRRI